MKFSESGQEYVENATLNLNDGLVCEIVSSGAFISSTKFIYGASNRLSHYVGLFSNISFEWNDDKLIYLREDVIAGSMNDMAYTYKSNIVTKGYNPLFPFAMSSASFFMAHPEINASAVARRLGIAQSLLAQYISGTKHPSEERLESIKNEIKKIGAELVAAW